VFFVAAGAAAFAADNPAAGAKPGEPTNPKAHKTWESAIQWESHRDYASAVSDFLKANRQDGGQCTECLRHAYLLAIRIGDDKDAEEAARDMLALAGTPAAKARAHYLIATALQRQGIRNKKEKCFTDSCPEFQAALDQGTEFNDAHFGLGLSLAKLHQDEEAKKQFAAYLGADKDESVMHLRAERYLENPDLARARMAPPFSIITLDGQQVSLDALAGKVVLIDFWATWCGPCREALPHIRNIAQKFSEQPLVVISISLDKDQAKWKDFVAKNGMTWLQYRDGSFDGSIARSFGVQAIPATFTIDADGVLQDQHVGDADIERKLKKLVAQAAEFQKHKSLEAAAPSPAQSN